VRGWAGVLAVLESCGLLAEALVGVSAGGMVAVLHALGWPPEAIRDFIAETHLAQVWSFEPGRQALLANSKMQARLEAAVGDRTFADLPQPVVVVAADLDTGHEVHLCSGRLDQALMATMAIPGLLEPVCVGGRRLADGGLLNPLPLNVARRWRHPVVAVDVMASLPTPETHTQLFESQGPFGYLADLSQHLGFGGTLELINLALQLMSGRLRDDTLRLFPPDVLVCPEVASVGLFAFDLAARAYQQGLAAAQRALPELTALANQSQPM
jgi:NTE family protein